MITLFAFLLQVHAAPVPVTYVDPQRYAGDWYQIAHVPMFFEGFEACGCARQRLTLASDHVDVYNSCVTASGKQKEIRGEAYIDDPGANARLTVDFHLLYKGSYWIVGLDPDYRFAVVTDKHAYSLYILSRTPELAADLYASALAIANEQGLRTRKLEITAQRDCRYP